MSKMTNYLENKILDHVLKNTAFSQPAALYLGLFTSDPTDAVSGTEVSGSGYARQVISFAAASGGQAASSLACQFAASGGAFGTVTHWCIFDAVSAGNGLIHGAFTASKVIADGDTAVVAVGDIVIAAD